MAKTLLYSLRVCDALHMSHALDRRKVWEIALRVARYRASVTGIRHSVRRVAGLWVVEAL